MAKTKEKHDVNELRELSKDELLARAGERRKTLFELKSKHSTGVLDSTADLGKTRRDIARCLTVAREKERATVANLAGKKE